MASFSNGQADVIDFLSKPETYGLVDGSVERYETHGALVFLAGDKAYKLKRAVRFPYMDYSTRERRRHMCERELVVNRRTAPDIYLGVQPIVRDPNGRLHFGTADEATIMDWVVVMRRFDQDNLLERMRQRGRLKPSLIRLLAETIAGFHQRAEVCHDSGGVEGVAAVIADNGAIIRSLMDRPFDAPQIDRFSRLSEAMLDRGRKILQKRRMEGRVRRCHGDLHLNNICLIGGQPVLFDAIEFSESFACIDVLYDLAFLLMDLDRHRLRGYANVLLNRYLELSGDYDGVAVLPLFLSCRAAIRAHVAAVAAGIVQPKKDQLEAKLREAAELFDQAICYLEPPAARLVAVGGVSGTGKSTLARNLAAALGPAPGAVVIRSDVMRKRLMGVTETTRLPATAYQPEFTLKVYSAIADLAAKVIAAGHAVIADAVYADSREREQIEEVAVAAGVRFDGLWLGADPALLQDRISARHDDASDATIDVLRRQLNFVDRPKDWVTVNATRTPPEVAEEARRRLASEKVTWGSTRSRS